MPFPDPPPQEIVYEIPKSTKNQLAAATYQQRPIQKKRAKGKPKLILYTRSTCPYCKNVSAYLQQVNKTLPSRDLNQSAKYRKELKKIGGKVQVPCLLINGKPLYESEEIIAWLKQHPDQY